MKPPRSETDIKDAMHSADHLEPAFARAFLLSVAKMRDEFTIYEASTAFAEGSVAAVMDVIKKEAVDRSLSPLVSIASDAFMRGWRMGDAHRKDLLP